MSDPSPSPLSPFHPFYWIPLLLTAAILLALASSLLGGCPFPSVHHPPSSPTVTEEEQEKPPLPLLYVVIDPGHGGEDGGAISATGIPEKDLNLSVALAMRDLFHMARIPVVMTRTEDTLLYDRSRPHQGHKKALDLAARRLLAEKTATLAQEKGGTSLFISIHMNAFPQPQCEGLQVWYGLGSPLSASIADSIQAASLSLQPHNTRRIQAATGQIYLLDRLASPAVLVECGFLSNPDEAKRLSREAYRHALAAVIFTGVIRS